MAPTDRAFHQHDEETSRLEAEERIQELKRRAAAAAGDQMIAWESPDLPDQLREGFWRHVVDFDTAPMTTWLQQLAGIGLEFPDPGAIDDAQLPVQLQQLIEGLARIRVFLTNTDHLSDRELYSRLVRDALREDVPDIGIDPRSAWHLDLLGTGSEEDIRLYLKYFADDRFREDWSVDNPEFEMPEHEDPPSDRDRLLPRPRDLAAAP